MRLIDADTFARWLDKNHYIDKPTGKCDDRQNRVLGIAISAVKNPEICPTIDAEPVKHGRWEWYEEPYDSRNPDGDYGWRCSECKQDLATELTFGITGMDYAYAILNDPDAPPTLKRCLFCGAKMKAKED